MITNHPGSRRFAEAFLLAAAIAVALSTNHAAGWNDGSRLATVECLVDYGTWAIDDSVFAKPLEERSQLPADPYGRERVPRGTLDKLFIDGHYYSDKSPVPALLMAGPYWLWRQCGGPAVAERPDRVCWFLCLCSSGLAYVLAVVGIERLARGRLVVTASFAIATVALPYAGAVNNHIVLLAVTVWLLVQLPSFPSSAWERTAAKLCFADGSTSTPKTSREAELRKQCVPKQSLGTRTRGGLSFFAFGTLAGLAYTIDLGVGPFLWFGAMLFAAYHRSWLAPLAALPWLILHHALNYAIGGTLRPANANPEYFNWPDCPFNASNMTGTWNHASPLAFLLYAADMLVGKRGFLLHNPALLLAVPAWFALWRQRELRPHLLLCGFWCVGTWLVYAATSTNMAGECCSVRWLVPLVAPGYFVLIQWLERRPEFTIDLIALSLAGTLINLGSAWRGPWSGRMPPGYWGLVALAAIAWWGRVPSSPSIGDTDAAAARRLTRPP